MCLATNMKSGYNNKSLAKSTLDYRWLKNYIFVKRCILISLRICFDFIILSYLT